MHSKQGVGERRTDTIMITRLEAEVEYLAGTF